MDDVTAERLAALKRKRAALKEQGAEDRAAELAGQIKAIEDEDPLPSAPRVIPSPLGSYDAQHGGTVDESPKHASPKPQTRRTGRPAK